MNYHNPVLLLPSIESLITNFDGIYVDVTFGGGGHSRKILEKLEKGKLLAFDQDQDSIRNLIEDERFQFVPYNFKYLKRFLQYYNAYPCDGILADLGVSSYQFDTPERGFSHRFDGVLDMRMNRQKGASASDILNEYTEKKLADMFYTYGELAQGGRLANQIVKEREKGEIKTTNRLVEIVNPLLQRGKENKQLSQIFQSIRIEINDEMGALRDFLLQTLEVLKPGGRLVVISYHSLEDRLVKNFMKSGNFKGEVEKDFFGHPQVPFRLITRKAITPNEEEIAVNPRARSAKLRVVEKI
ncbi:MAG: 16S rRNA (cytosine(1402)-N(4))-methyltransferase RsmH [Bacteroidales bacterium]